MVTDNKNLQETRLQTLTAHTAYLHMCAGMLPLHLHLHHVAPLWPTVAPHRLQDQSIHPDEQAAMGPQSIPEHWSCHGCENMLQGLPATHTHTMPMFCGINQLLWHLLAFRLSNLTALGSTRIALAWLVVVHCGVPNGVRCTCPAMH